MSGYLGLQQVTAGLRYKRGWEFWLACGHTQGALVPPSQSLAQAGGVLTSGSAWPVLLAPVFLHIAVTSPDSGDLSGDPRSALFIHSFAVPVPGKYGPAAWDRWVLDRILDVERHEAMEFFRVNGERPFFPRHGGGREMYRVLRPAVSEA